MKVGVTIERFEGFEPAQLVHTARRLGVEMVELNPSSFDAIDDVAAALRSLPAGLHLPLMGQDGFDFSCPAHQRDINALIDAVNAGWRRLHLRYALSHPPEPAEAAVPIETSEELLLENLARLDLPILLENVPSWEPRSFERFYDAARRKLGPQLLGICLDAPHAFLRGEDPSALLNAWAPEVKGIHLSDCSRTEDLHLPFKSGGVLPVDDFLRTVRNVHFHGFLILEIQPATMEELRPLVESYLHVLRRLKPLAYVITKARLLLALARPRTRGLLRHGGDRPRSHQTQ